MTTTDVACLLVTMLLGVGCGGAVEALQQTHAILASQPVVLSADQAEARFGRCIDGAGDVNGDGYDDLIIGSPYYDAGSPFEGRAWVFLGGPTGPEQTPVWVTESNQAQARWGRLVAGAGDVNADGYDDVLVGAHFWSGSQSLNGLVSVFHGGPGGLDASPDWSVEGQTEAAGLGWSADGVGDLNGDGYDDVALGAWQERVAGHSSGAVHVWYGSASGLTPGIPDWTTQATTPGDQLGASVRGAGDVNGDGYADVIAGAPGRAAEERATCGLAAPPAWRTPPAGARPDRAGHPMAGQCHPLGTSTQTGTRTSLSGSQHGQAPMATRGGRSSTSAVQRVRPWSRIGSGPARSPPFRSGSPLAPPGTSMTMATTM